MRNFHSFHCLQLRQFPLLWTLLFTSLFHSDFVHTVVHNSNAKAKIVVIHPVTPTSHELTISVLTDELIRRGHTVHVVKWKDDTKPDKVGYGVSVTHPVTNLTKNVTTLAMDGSDGRFFVLSREKEAGFIFPSKLLWDPGLTSTAKLFHPEWANYFTFLEAHCDTLLSNQKLIHKLRCEHFDLAIIDMSWNECSIALVRSLQIKSVVGFWLSTPASIESDLTTTFLTSSHQGVFEIKRGGGSSSVMTRVYNGFAKFTSQLVMWIYYYHIDRSIARHLPKLQCGSQQLQKNLDGMLINDHLVLGIPKPLPPNYFNVGGLQINGAKPPPLPQDVETWLNDAPHGVIFFSFGTLVPLCAAPSWIQNTFLQAFRRIPQKVFLQLEPSFDRALRMNGSISDNVKTFHWISQQSVLAHPNVQLFITHGGQQSALESIYAEVPMIVFPVVHDAPETSSKLVAKGVAVELDRYYVTVDEIVAGINRVLGDPIYKKNIQAMSRIMRYEMNTSHSPLFRAADFLEYLIAHDGAPHLKIPDSNVTIVQYFHLDVLAFFLPMFAVVYIVMKWIVARLAYIVYLFIVKSAQFVAHEDQNADSVHHHRRDKRD